MVHCTIRITIEVHYFSVLPLFPLSLSPFPAHPSILYLSTRLEPLHDSDSILLVRSSHYRKHVGAVREWYSQEHDNWHVVNGEQSQWWVGNKVRGHALHYALQIQQYLTRITAG